MMNKGLQKNTNDALQRQKTNPLKMSFGKSQRSTSETPMSKNRSPTKQKSEIDDTPKHNGPTQVFGRSALIKASFFSKESKPLDKSPIFDHSPFLNKTLLNGKKEPKKMNKSAQSLFQEIGSALEKKIY